MAVASLFRSSSVLVRIKKVRATTLLLLPPSFPSISPYKNSIETEHLAIHETTYTTARRNPNFLLFIGTRNRIIEQIHTAGSTVGFVKTEKDWSLQKYLIYNKGINQSK